MTHIGYRLSRLNIWLAIFNELGSTVRVLSIITWREAERDKNTFPNMQIGRCIFGDNSAHCIFKKKKNIPFHILWMIYMLKRFLFLNWYWTKSLTLNWSLCCRDALVTRIFFFFISIIWQVLHFISTADNWSTNGLLFVIELKVGPLKFHSERNFQVEFFNSESCELISLFWTFKLTWTTFL